MLSCNLAVAPNACITFQCTKRMLLTVPLLAKTVKLFLALVTLFSLPRYEFVMNRRKDASGHTHTRTHSRALIMLAASLKSLLTRQINANV